MNLETIAKSYGLQYYKIFNLKKGKNGFIVQYILTKMFYNIKLKDSL